MRAVPRAACWAAPRAASGVSRAASLAAPSVETRAAPSVETRAAPRAVSKVERKADLWVVSHQRLLLPGAAVTEAAAFWVRRFFRTRMLHWSPLNFKDRVTYDDRFLLLIYYSFLLLS
jgi:hypothetical protein